MIKIKKKYTVAAIAAVVGIAAVTGGIAIARKVVAGDAKVYAASNFIMTDYYADSSTYSGYVTADKMQAVYVSSTQQVTSIAVTEGQEVKTGDLLMTYDTTLSDIELKKAEISVQRLKLQLENAKAELAEIQKLKPYVEPVATPTPDLTPVTTPYKHAGSGTAEDPYIYVIDDENVFDNAFVEKLMGDKDELYVVFATLQENSLNGELLNYWGVCFVNTTEDVVETAEETTSSEPTASASPDTTDEPTSEPTTPPFTYTFSFFSAEEPQFNNNDGSSDSSDQTSSYTAAEIAKMKAEKQTEIQDTDVSMRLAQVEYERMQKEVSDGNVYATVDGVVTAVLDADTAQSSGKPMVVVSGGGGYYIQASVSELEKDDMEVGQEVQATDWSTGMVYTGSITEVSDTPSDMGGYTNGNSNVSYYQFTVFIDSSAALQEGQYMDLSYSAAANSDSIYLMNAFISTENGKSYAYVRGEDNKLERRELTTGKIVWGEYTQIYSGLSEDDYIAFPYGSSIKEGAKTQEGELEDLYS